MALGFGTKSRTVDHPVQEINANNGSPNSAEKQGEFYDPEANNDKGRKMSRIGGTLGESDTDSQLTVGKQLELEATNSIKYRTCSWQKVIISVNLLFFSPSIANCGTFFGVLATAMPILCYGVPTHHYSILF